MVHRQKPGCNFEEALKYFRDGFTIAKKLADFDKPNSDVQRDLALSYKYVGLAYVRLGDTAKALNAFGQGQGIIVHLAASSADNEAWREMISRGSTARSPT